MPLTFLLNAVFVYQDALAMLLPIFPVPAIYFPIGPEEFPESVFLVICVLPSLLINCNDFLILHRVCHLAK
jgi:hypothetical protein